MVFAEAYKIVNEAYAPPPAVSVRGLEALSAAAGSRFMAAVVTVGLVHAFKMQTPTAYLKGRLSAILARGMSLCVKSDNEKYSSGACIAGAHAMKLLGTLFVCDDAESRILIERLERVGLECKPERGACLCHGEGACELRVGDGALWLCTLGGLRLRIIDASVEGLEEWLFNVYGATLMPILDARDGVYYGLEAVESYLLNLFGAREQPAKRFPRGDR